MILSRLTASRMILVDTSVWIQHIHAPIARLAELLDDLLVLSHPFVVGELSCGNIRGRKQQLEFMAELPAAPLADHAEALALIEQRRLMGKGLTYADIHLLASAAIGNGVELWTNDKKLNAAASAMGKAFRP